MEHVSPENLARLVDEDPTPEEAEHLASCAACAAELAALREQTAALAGLPEIMPPRGDWKVLEAQLRSEGLVRDPGLFQRIGLAQTPSWMKAAAAAVLFLSGAGTGAALTRAEAAVVGTPTRPFEQIADLDEAATALKSAEESYVSAVTRYRELLAQDGGEGLGSDPISRFAALEHIVAVSQAAVRQAPGDPFLNGFLASAMAERDAALRMVSSRRDNWF